MKKYLSLVVIMAIFMSGCATIVSKSEYPVKITSNPSGAKIKVTNKAGNEVFTGETPATVTLKAGAGFFSGEDYIVEFKKDGHSAVKGQINRGVDGWYIFGNFFSFNWLGWLVIDPVTGAMWKLDDLHRDLGSSGASLNTQGLNIVSIDDVPQELRSNLVKITKK